MISVQEWAQWMEKGSSSIPKLLLENYKKLHLSDTEMMLLIHIHTFLSEGVSFPSIKQLEQRMTCTQTELTQMLNRLRKEKFLAIQSRVDEQGRLVEKFSLQPLWEKLIRYLTINVEEVSQRQDDPIWPTYRHREQLAVGDGEEAETIDSSSIYQCFEKAFGRPLSPMEYETITAWLDTDQIDAQLILLALREAISVNKPSIRYIDKILLEWQKKGLNTLGEVRNHIKQFRLRQQTAPETRPKQDESVNFPFYNWLER